jgi:murein DD-endopeptidase MepM/ murein hydrolase activator NlpD
MAKKFLSLIVVPHTKTSCRTFSFSRNALRAAAGGLALFVLVLGGFLFDYFSMGSLRQRYRALLQESEQQKTALARYEKTVNELQATITSFENYAKKLNIMAGLKSPDVLTAPAGLGSGAPEGGEANDQALSVPASGPQAMSPAALQGLSQKAGSIEQNLSSLVSYFETKTALLAATPSIMPVAGWLSSRFGMRTDPFTGREQMHAGIDISTNTGNPVVATADGIVIKVTTDRFLGKHIVISHGYGLTTLYAHLNGFAVKEGRKVKRGEVIGYVGQTGKALGPHLHYEVRNNGRAVNPLNYVLEE